MTEQKLPTRAYRWRDKAGLDQSSINNPEDEWCDNYSQIHGKEELVRREDVENLIQRKHGELIEKLEHLSEDEKTGMDTLTQALLEEVQEE